MAVLAWALPGASQAPEVCDGSVDVRRIDGRCNNLDSPEWGAPGASFRVGPEGADFTPVDFTDPNQNGRSLSNAYSQTSDLRTGTGCITGIGWLLGQLVTHDIQILRVETGEPLRIPLLDANDPLLLDRPPGFPAPVAPYIPISPTDAGNPEDPGFGVNDATAWLDLSPVYGVRDDLALALRTDGGKLITRDYAGATYDLNPIGIPFRVVQDLSNMPPSMMDIGIGDFPGLEHLAGPEFFPDETFATGDPGRTGTTLYLAALQTLFVREHNRLAESYAAMHPDWDDEQLYQAARRINIAQYQHIVVQEWVRPRVLRGYAFRYRGYDPDLDPAIGTLFTTANANGHSQQLPPSLKDADFQPLYPPPLDEPFFFGQTGGPGLQQLNLMAYGQGLEAPLRGMASQLSGPLDLGVVDELRNVPIFSTRDPDLAGIDLMAITHTRARLNGLPGYYEARKAHFVPGVPEAGDLYNHPLCQRLADRDSLGCFWIITGELTLAKRFRDQFKRVTDLPLVLGLWSEYRPPRRELPRTMANILREQFSRLIHADRFYYEHELTRPELRAVRRTTLSDLIARNTDAQLWPRITGAPLPGEVGYPEVSCTPQ